AIGSEKVALANEEDGRAGFDEKQHLSGIFIGEKAGEGLLDAVVEDAEVFAPQAFDEVTSGVGNEDADVDAVGAGADARWMSGRWLLAVKVTGTCEAHRERKGNLRAVETGHAINLVEPLLKVEAFGVLPGSRKGGMEMARENLWIDLLEPGR